jgi:hypothetical protein
MFNRKLEVDVVKVKKAKDVSDPVPELTFEEKSNIVEARLRKLLVTAGWIGIGWIAMDTLRKIAVEAAKAD